MRNLYIGHIKGLEAADRIMKKKIIVAVCIAFVVLCAGLIIICGNKSLQMYVQEAASVFEQSSSEEDELWTSKDTGSAVLENDTLRLELDCETSHFVVIDKQSGKRYYSVAESEITAEQEDSRQAEVVVTYFDSKSTSMTMNSTENSVRGKHFSIKTNGDAIRVCYSIQKSEEVTFVPPVLSQDTFENAILAKVEKGATRRLKRFYTLYESDAEDKKTVALKKEYPALTEQNLYILNDSAGESVYGEISECMTAAGYKQSDYEKECAMLNLENTVADNLPAAFSIPVEYRLTEEGLTATILRDQISSVNENYKLTDIALLPYFFSCEEAEEGWFLVPDGSGAIIKFADKAGKSYAQNIWGKDLAVEESWDAALVQNVGMPVFGFHNGTSAVFGIISGGAASASLEAEVYGNAVAQSRIGAKFRILSYDSTNIGSMSQMAAFNLYASEYIEEFPQVTYLFFTEKETTYSDMAGRYRSYLQKNGTLGERLTETEQFPVYLDFTGYETIDSSFLGIPTEKKIVLSRLANIQKALEELETRGIKDFHVRLKAYGNGGVYGSVSNGFALENSVGSAAEIEKLAEYLKEKGGLLYFENNIGTVYSEGSSFDKVTHATHSLKKKEVAVPDYDLVMRDSENYERTYYITSPAYFKSLTENFVTLLKKKSDSLSVYGYSWSDFGSKLWSDFSTEHAYDRTETIYAAGQSMQYAKDHFVKTMTDGSNIYALPYSDSVLNIPLTSSYLYCESYSIPFYQMVIHGYIDFAGAPVNTGANMDSIYLASIESGASLYYSFFTEGEEALKKTSAGALVYPTSVQRAYDKVEEQYAQFAELFSGLRCQIITNHERVEENVYITTYEFGTKIAVNYNGEEVVLGNIRIPAYGYAVVEKGE